MRLASLSVHSKLMIILMVQLSVWDVDRFRQLPDRDEGEDKLDIRGVDEGASGDSQVATETVAGLDTCCLPVCSGDVYVRRKT